LDCFAYWCFLALTAIVLAILWPPDLIGEGKPRQLWRSDLVNSLFLSKCQNLRLLSRCNPTYVSKVYGQKSTTLSTQPSIVPPPHTHTPLLPLKFGLDYLAFCFEGSLMFCMDISRVDLTLFNSTVN
jgi:hypothetical protein